MDNPLKKNRLVEYSLYLGCLLSNLSQLPMVVQAGATQKLAFPGWILLAASLMLTKRLKLGKLVITQLGFGAILVIWLLLDSLLISKSQFGSSMFYSYMISMFVFLLGSWSSDYVDERVLKNINVIFVVSTLVITASIFVEYFGTGYNLASRRYAYSSKNSVSQIIFTAIILLIVRFRSQNTVGKIIKVGAIAFETYVILLLRSRATLVSLLLCILVMAFAKNSNKKIKAAIAIVGIGFIGLLIASDTFNNFIFNYVIFANRSVSNLNDLTSGRVNIVGRFPQMISGNWITGIGPTYYECFPLSAILQFGLIGGLLCIFISLQPLWYSFKFRRMSSDWYFLFLVAIGYSVNGLFEGLTPFGPGVKCYYMWLLFGLLIGRRFIPTLEEKIKAT